MRTWANAAIVVALVVAGTTAPAQSAVEVETVQITTGPYLGVTLQDLNDDLRESYDYRGDGVVVTSVESGGPADRAGLQEGDIITRFDGRTVRNSADLTTRVRQSRAGDQVSIEVYRNGARRTLRDVELGSRRDIRVGDPDQDGVPGDEPGPRRRVIVGPDDEEVPGPIVAGAVLGVEVRDVDLERDDHRNVPGDRGATVERVLDNSAADRAGIREGDILVSFDGQRVDDAADLRRLVRENDGGRVSIVLYRAGSRRTVTATLDAGPVRPVPPGGGWGNDARSRELRSEIERLRREIQALRRELDDHRRRDH